jgi:hypothetical protein
MKKIILFSGLAITILLLNLNALSSADKISGVIHFADGNTLEFSNIIHFSAFIREKPPTKEAIPVRFADELKLVPLSQLKSFKIVDFDIVKLDREGGPPAKVWTGTAEVETTSGEKVRCKYDSFGIVEVEVTDKSTGAARIESIFIIDFKAKSLKIKEIVFNN